MPAFSYLTLSCLIVFSPKTAVLYPRAPRQSRKIPRKSLPKRPQFGKLWGMKKQRALVGLFISCLIGICTGQEDAISQWTVKDFWGQLQEKMTEAQALELLGRPLDRESTDTACVWYYQEAPVREGDQVIRRPRSGLLRFRRGITEGREALLLISWTEPDWEKVQAHTLAQWQALQRRLEQAEQQKQLADQRQKQVEQKAAERVNNIPAPSPVAKPTEPVKPTNSQTPIDPVAPTSTTPPEKQGILYHQSWRNGICHHRRDHHRLGNSRCDFQRSVRVNNYTAYISLLR